MDLILASLFHAFWLVYGEDYAGFRRFWVHRARIDGVATAGC